MFLAGKSVLFYGALVALVLAAASFILSAPIVGVQQLTYNSNVGEITREVGVGQTFVADYDGLSGVAVRFATYSDRSNTETVEFRLREAGTSDTDVRHITVVAPVLEDNQFYRFSFEPIAHSRGKTFFFFLVSPRSVHGNAVTIDVDTRNPYGRGSANVMRDLPAALNNPTAVARSEATSSDLSFTAHYTVRLSAALVYKLFFSARTFIATWSEQLPTYVVWLTAAVPAVLLVVFLFFAVGLGAKVVRVFLLLIFAAALAIRLLYAAELPATNDEGNYLYDSWAMLQGRLAGGDGYVKAPLVVAWVALWQLVFDNTLFAGRFASVLAGALTIYPLYFLGRALGGRAVGLTAAALWALLGVTTVFTIYVHTQPLPLFFAVSGLAVLAVVTREVLYDVRSLVQRRPYIMRLFLAGVLLGLGVISRKSVLALGLVPLLLIGTENVSFRKRLVHIIAVGLGFLMVLGVFLLFSFWLYGSIGIWEALGVNSAEDGISGGDPDEAQQVREYSLRGMTPFFRESLPLIMLAVIGLGIVLETLAARLFEAVKLRMHMPWNSFWSFILPKIVWVVPLAVYWWAWSFFLEYEGEERMVFGMSTLWYVMAIAVGCVALLPPARNDRMAAPHDVRFYLVALFLPTLWFAGLVVFYMNWIKFHANYIGEFLPPLVLLAALGFPAVCQRVASRGGVVRRLCGASFAAVLVWTLFVTGFVTYVYEHTGTYQLTAVYEAAAWARVNIPLDKPIFTGAALIPYMSGHRAALDIAHPRWYAYEFTRKDPERLNTFLPPIRDMLQAFADSRWFLLDQQTEFSFFMEYEQMKESVSRDFERVHGVSNGGNTLTFYRRVRSSSEH